MKRSSWIWILLAVIIVAVLVFKLQHKKENVVAKKTIYIASIVEIQPISDLRNGFIEALAFKAGENTVTYLERNAQGDAGLMASISDEISVKKPDLVYVLGTPLAQIIQNNNPDIVLVQGAVTDPVTAGLADSWDGSGKNYAANSDKPPVTRILSLLKNVQPEAKNIGVLFNPSESNSVSVVNSLKLEAAMHGLEITDFPVSNITDLPLSLSSALSNSDALIIPPDNLVTSGLDLILADALESKIPVFATTESASKSGALAAVTTNFEQLGYEAGEIAYDILFKDADPAKMPILPPQNISVVLNKSIAEKLGIDYSSIPKDTLIVVE